MEFVPLLLSFLLGLVVAFVIWMTLNDIWDDIRRHGRSIERLQERIYDLESAAKEQA